MGKNKTNTFKKAIHHLKSKQIDEKLELLNEIPTNNSAGIYVVEPEYQVQDPDVPGEVTREANFTQDALVNGRDTTGLFDVDGTTILTIEPPDALGDKSFILGPMASMWYSWGNFSTIGYIRQSDRRMVDLGRITGQLGSWNGTSGFTSYGQLLLNQAVWFRDTPKLNGADNNTPNYRSFYPGPPSNSPDQYGRYLCVITGTPKPTTTTPPPRRVPPVVGPFDKNLPPGSALPKNKIKKPKKGPPGVPKGPKGPPGVLAKLNGKTGQFDTKGNWQPIKWSSSQKLAIDLQKNIVNFRNENKKLLSQVGQTIANGLLSAGALVMGMTSATNMLASYNNFLGNSGKGVGSSPKNPIDLSKQLSTKDMNALVKSINDPTIKSVITKAAINSNNNKPLIDPTTKKPTTVGKTYSEVAASQIMQKVNQAIESNPGLSNTLHNNVQVDMKKTLETGNVVLTKAYVFRSGGSVSQSENNPVGKLLTAVGVPLDTLGSGGLYAAAGLVAGAIGLTNSSNYGGLYNSPPMYYQITVPNTPIKEECEYSDNRKRILKEVKKPYVLPEQPKVKYTFKPKVNRTINPDLMKKAEVPTSFKPAEERLWGKYEKEQNARFSQERKNEVLDHLGGSDHAWEYMTETSRNKNNDIMYGNFGDSKKKIVRKEELKGDTLLFIVDENGKKESILQSELSIEIANEYNKELFSNYFQEQETLQADKDPLFKKVSKRLKKEIDYDDKPSSKGYPNDPPPEMVNGWHPEYGNKSNYYNTLDPHSANSMPATGNAEIDAKVRRAKTLKRVLGKKA